MKLIVISDVHANWPALNEVDRETGDALIFLGDAVTYGTRPAESIDWIRKRARWAVAGNHDRAIVEGKVPRCRPQFRAAAEATIHWHKTLLDDFRLDFERELPSEARFKFGGFSFYATHATPAAIDEYLDGNAAVVAALREINTDVILLGHTHRRLELRVGGRLIVNPGSIGQPRDGQGNGSYAVIENGNVEFRSIPLDRAAIATDFERSPIPIEIQRQLLETLEPRSRGPESL